MLIMNGSAFIDNYFPSPKFIKLLKRARIPALITIQSLIYANILAFMMAKTLKLKKASAWFFSGFAMNSPRYGMVRALNWRPNI